MFISEKGAMAKRRSLGTNVFPFGEALKIVGVSSIEHGVVSPKIVFPWGRSPNLLIRLWSLAGVKPINPKQICQALYSGDIPQGDAPQRDVLRGDTLLDTLDRTTANI